jgi:hypothetical protein
VSHQLLWISDEEIGRRAHEISQEPVAVARSAEENWYQAMQELRAEREPRRPRRRSAKAQQSSS